MAYIQWWLIPKRTVSFSTFCLLLLVTFSLIALPEQKSENSSTTAITIVAPKKENTQPIKCLALCLESNPLLIKTAKAIKDDLEFTDQLVLELRQGKQIPTEKQLKALYAQDTSLCLLLQTNNTDSDQISATLIDTYTRATILSKTYPTSGSPLLLAHTISNDLIPTLTGQPSITMTTLAFCAQQSPYHKIIYTCDYTGKIIRKLIGNKTLNISPVWHPTGPMLLYSTFSPQASALRAYHLMSKKTATVCAMEGLNMQPSFSADGTRVALCLSARTGNSEIYLYDQKLCQKMKRRIFTQLTHNGGNNSSPCLLPNDDVVFCSDFRGNLPQLYILDRKNHAIKKLTRDHFYCASPSFHAKTNTIAYTKHIDGIFQIFTMTLNEQGGYKEIQCTFNEGDKIDPTWSPCGNFIAFTYDIKSDTMTRKVPQIALLNKNSGSIKLVTSSDVPKSFAAWTDRSFFTQG